MKSNPRILLGCEEICGQLEMLARALRTLGHDARSLSLRKNWLAYPDCDYQYHLERLPRVFRPLLALWPLFARAPRFGVIHFQFGLSFLPFNLDLPLLSLLGKRMVMTFHGCDVRMRERNQRLDVSICEACLAAGGACQPDSWKESRVDRLRRRMDALIVTEPALLDYVPDAHWVPVALDLEALDPVQPAPIKQRPLVVHAPSSRATKGTAGIVATVEELQRGGLEFDFRIVEGVPHGQALAIYREADIAIDQVVMGWHCLFAVEMMALGRPVVAYIRDDLRARAPDLPVVSARPETLGRVLTDLVTKSTEELAAIGAAGRRYAEANHGAAAVARRLLALYGIAD